MALAEKIDAAGIIPFAHSNAEWRPTNEWFVGEFLNHIAGPAEGLSGPDRRAPSGPIPTSSAAIEALDQMQQNGWFMGGLDRYYTPTEADADAILADGEAP